MCNETITVEILEKAILEESTKKSAAGMFSMLNKSKE